MTIDRTASARKFVAKGDQMQAEILPSKISSRGVVYEQEEKRKNYIYRRRQIIC